MVEIATDQGARDAEGMIRSDLVRSIKDALTVGARDHVRALAGDLHEADLADLVELLPADSRVGLVRALGDTFKPGTLSELDEQVRDQLVEALPNAQIAEALKELESDDAAYVLEHMGEEDRAEILAQIPQSDRVAVERALDYPGDTAGRLMQADLISVPAFWSVGQAIDFMRENENLPDTFSEIFVTTPAFHLLGTVPLDRLLRTRRPVPMADIMVKDPHTILATEDQEDVARAFQRYDLMSAPVVDADQRIVGVITVDDVVEVIQDEAEEDIKLLAGLGDESLADSVLATTRNRFTWLLINLVTAVLASIVIKLFDASIEQMVALAVLMPIVASMGGNAGTQTMTIAVRALAMRELGPVNARRVILREASVGLLNGLLFAAIMSAVAIAWFGIGSLGLVIAAAMIFNLLAAALAGILIPLGLDRLGYDPAVASVVFVTTVTDVVGFFAFLGLATLWLL